MDTNYLKKVTSQKLSLLLTFMLCVTIVTAQTQRPANQKPKASKGPIQLVYDVSDTSPKGDQIKSATDVSDFLNQMVRNQQLTEADADYVITSEHVSSLSDMHHIYYRQAINNIEVQGTESSLHLASDGTFVTAHSDNLIKEISGAVKSSASSLNAAQAIQAIANQMNYGTITNLKEITSSKSTNTAKLFNNGGISGVDIPAKQMYYVVPNDGIRMVWEISIQELNSSDWWNFRVDANTGVIIDKYNFTVSCNLAGDHSDHNHNDLSNEEICEDVVPETLEIAVATVEETAFVGSYGVYALPIESPYFGVRTTVTDPDDPTASPFGWHDTDGAPGPEFTITRGNNTLTVDDIDNNNTGGQAVDGGAGLNFNFAFEDTQTQFGIPNIPRFSTDNRSLAAALTNTFYWTNIIHDITYHYGFDEASGNFQQNNYGNGGTGNDPVLGDVQDGSGTCNANFGTPPEGSAPRMQMFTCGVNDGDYDNLVIVHEYAHGISTRLTGGGANSGSLTNQEQQGEGWSDYYGYMYTMDASNFDDDRTVGTFLFAQGPAGNGIRSFPYSASTATNPQTYQTLINLGNGNIAPHLIGEIWATMLYDLTQELIATHGFDPDLYNGTGGNNISLALVTEGLKLQPASPGFVDSRDAILLADQMLFGGANQCIIWETFADRGLGFSADQGDSDVRSDGTAAFDVPPITLAVSETSVCLASGAVSLGGGVVAGGTYSGTGVSDDGNGSTFTFDPVMAGVGTHTITYTAVDCNGDTNTDTDTITVTEVLPELDNCTDVTLALGADGTVTYNPFEGFTGDIVGRTSGTGTGFAFLVLPGAAITQAVEVTFNWEFNSTDPVNEFFGYLEDTFAIPLSNATQTNQEGSFTFTLVPGQQFGFGIFSSNGASTGSTASVTNFMPGYTGDLDTSNWVPILASGTDGSSVAFSGDPAPSLVSCGDITTSLSQSVFTCLDIGTTTPVTVTVTDSLGNTDTCVANVTITGGENTTTFTGGAWDNGDPTGISMAIINDDYDTATLGDINACSCQIDENQTVTVRDGNFMNITGNIVVDGTLIVENAGSVVQMDDAAITTNNGTIMVQKTTPSLQPRDFVLLSSPMSGETRTGVYDSADRVFLIDATEFEPDASTTGSGTGVTFLDVDGNYFSPASSLNVGEGYIVFPQAVSDVGDVNFEHTYTQGTLNSGTIDFPLVYNGSTTANNFNLMGNPYPSAIDVTALLDQNVAINEVYYWEHITTPNDSIPGFNTANFSMDDVSIRNELGGIASANGGTIPGPFMASGQGFGILADNDVAGTPLTFNNSMRVTDNNGTVRSNELDINRLWLRLDSETFSLQNINLIGFTPEATIDFDDGFDSERLATTISLFSTLDSGEYLSIQGREAFDSSMEIDLGFATSIAESEQYTISIDQLEGADLENVGVYLIDNELGTITNLKENAYSFTATESMQSSRFTLVFEDRLLSTNTSEGLNTQIQLFPNPSNGIITLSYLGAETFTNAVVMDLNGKHVKEINLSNFNESLAIDLSAFSKGMYFIQISTQSTITTKKIILK